MSGTKGCHALESNMGKKNNPKYNLDMFLSKIYHSYAFLSKDFFWPFRKFCSTYINHM